MIDLDDTDRAMIRAVAQDALISAGTLGRQLGLSQPAAWRRLKACVQMIMLGPAA